MTKGGVIFFGGGMDPSNLNQQGNWLYMVDIETGKAIYKRRLEGSAPSDPAAVDYVGVSNLLTFMKTIPPYWKPEIALFKTRVGDHETEEGRKFLLGRSPIAQHYAISGIEEARLIQRGLLPTGERKITNVAAGRGSSAAGWPAFVGPIASGYVLRPQSDHFRAVVRSAAGQHEGGDGEPIQGEFAQDQPRLAGIEIFRLQLGQHDLAESLDTDGVRLGVVAAEQPLAHPAAPVARAQGHHGVGHGGVGQRHVPARPLGEGHAGLAEVAAKLASESNAAQTEIATRQQRQSSEQAVQGELRLGGGLDRRQHHRQRLARAARHDGVDRHLLDGAGRERRA